MRPTSPTRPAPRVTANSYKLMPGTTYTMDPTVTVKAGSEESYVRMKVTFNNAAALMEMLPSADNLEDYTPEEIALIKKIAPILFLTNYTAADTGWLRNTPCSAWKRPSLIPTTSSTTRRTIP